MSALIPHPFTNLEVELLVDGRDIGIDDTPKGIIGHCLGRAPRDDADPELGDALRVTFHTTPENVDGWLVFEKQCRPLSTSPYFPPMVWARAQKSPDVSAAIEADDKTRAVDPTRAVNMDDLAADDLVAAMLETERRRLALLIDIIRGLLPYAESRLEDIEEDTTVGTMQTAGEVEALKQKARLAVARGHGVLAILDLPTEATDAT